MISERVIIIIIICITIFLIVFLLRNSLSELIKKIHLININRNNITKETNLHICTEEKLEENITKNVVDINIEEKKEISDDCIFEVIDLIKIRKVDEAKKLFKELIKNETSAKEKERLNLIYDFNIYYYGIKLDYKNLENDYLKPTNNNEFKLLLFRLLSKLEEKYGKATKAIEYIEKSIPLGTTTDHNPIDTVTRIRLLEENKIKYNLQNIIIDYDNSDSSKKQKYLFFKELSELYNKDENYSLSLLEYGTQYVLNDIEALFNLAYKLKDIEKSLYYYKKVLDLNDNENAAKNNIGAACANLKMNIKAVQYYKESKEKENTLAGANLGYKLLNEGFVDEVNEIIIWARKYEKYDIHIDSLQTSLNEKVKKENEKFDKYIENAKIKNRFLSETGIYYIKKDIINLRGVWKDYDDNLSFEISEKENCKINLKLTKEDKTVYTSDSANINNSDIIKMSLKNASFILSGEKVTVTIVVKNKDLILLIEKENNLPEIRNLSFCDNS